MYNKVLEGKKWLLCPDAQAGSDYNELNLFLQILSAKYKAGDFVYKTQKSA